MSAEGLDTVTKQNILSSTTSDGFLMTSKDICDEFGEKH